MFPWSLVVSVACVCPFEDKVTFLIFYELSLVRKIFFSVVGKCWNVLWSWVYLYRTPSVEVYVGSLSSGAWCFVAAGIHGINNA